MQLNQPIPPSYSGGDQYDFILNGNQKPKKRLVPKPTSRKGRLIWVLGGGLALVFVIAVILSLVLGNGGSTATILTIAQDQTEIARVGTNGAQTSRDIATRNFAQTVASTMTSSQLQTISYLSSHNQKIKPQELALGKNLKTDANLKSAQAAGRYDQELIIVLEKSLADYRTKLSEAYKTAKSKSQKQLLQQLFDQSTILVKNQPTTSS